MREIMKHLIECLASGELAGTGVIPWAAPVPVFGDLSKSHVATLGLNPSKNEFVDEKGKELAGKTRRFHTLYSLGLNSWRDADDRHTALMLDSCRYYFHHNPYDRWFKKLDQVISGTGTSFYTKTANACHLDLIPFATDPVWGDLAPLQRTKLLSLAGNTLGLLVRDSPIEVLILNGSRVVQEFEKASGIQWKIRQMPEWSLAREHKTPVCGEAYYGLTNSFQGIKLRRPLVVLGFNHNIQSSFGLTNQVREEIQKWVMATARRAVG